MTLDNVPYQNFKVVVWCWNKVGILNQNSKKYISSFRDLHKLFFSQKRKTKLSMEAIVHPWTVVRIQLDSLPLVISIPSCPSSHHEALRIFWWNTIWSLQLLAEETFPSLFVSYWNVSFQMPMSLSKGQWSMIKVQPHYQVFFNSHHHSVTLPSFVC